MASNRKIETVQIIYCAIFVAFITVGAYTRIPIPVVPFTLQFLFTNLAGLILGERLGAFAVGAYVAGGLLGLPLFVGGGGLAYVLQPTFGYLVGFAVGAWAAGYVLKISREAAFHTILLASFANLAVVYAFGMVWYYFISNYYLSAPIGVWSLFIYCFALAVPGDAVLCFVSAVIAGRLIPILNFGGSR